MGCIASCLTIYKLASPSHQGCRSDCNPISYQRGYVCSDTHFLNEVCYTADIRELIAGGSFATWQVRREPMRPTCGASRSSEVSSSNLKWRRLSMTKSRPAVNEIVQSTAGRKKVIIFGCGIQHACEVTAMLDGMGHNVRIVTSEHGGVIRRSKISKPIQVLSSWSISTASPKALTLPTLMRLSCFAQHVHQVSTIKWLPRLRTHPDKQCLVLDFGGNIARHGTIDKLRINSPKSGSGGNGEAPVKECSECGLMVHAGLCVCPECGTAFPEREPNHESQASAEAPLSEVQIKDWYVRTLPTHCTRRKVAGRDQCESPTWMRWVSSLKNGSALSTRVCLCKGSRLVEGSIERTNAIER